MSDAESLSLDPPKPVARSAARRFAFNVVSLTSVQLANMLLPLLTMPYLVRIIGPERLGLLSFSQAYITYFTLLINYGFEMSAVRSIAANRLDRANTSRVFNEVLAGKTLLWLVSTLLFAGVTWGVADFRQYLWLHLCTYLSCVGTVLFPLWLYQAMEDLGRVAVFNLVVKLVFSVSIFVLVRRPDDYLYQTLALSVAQVLVSVIALRLALKRYGLSFHWPDTASLRRRFREDRSLFLSSVMITLYASSSTFLLGVRSDPYSVGIFAAGIRLEAIARSFVSLALNQAFFPIVAQAFGRGREQGLAMIRRILLPLLLGLVAISAVLWLAAPLFIHLLYGPGFEPAIEVLRVVSILTITIGLSNLFGFHVMLNLRKDRAFFAITAIGSVIGIALTFVLVDSFQHLGAAWAWVITEVYITLTMYAYLRYHGVTFFGRSSFVDSLQFTRLQLRKLLPHS